MPTAPDELSCDGDSTVLWERVRSSGAVGATPFDLREAAIGTVNVQGETQDIMVKRKKAVAIAVGQH